jgi:GntR family transcriptional regulator / MocR family aminotransferase
MHRASGEALDRTSGAGLDFLVGLGGPRGVRVGLEASIRAAIRDGRLHAGDALPSTRSLAGDLGIGRGTVVEAYTQLVAEGWLVAQQGRPTRVAAIPTSKPASAVRQRSPRWAHDLRPGRADPASFPRQEWAAALRHVLSTAPNEVFDYAEWRGRVELREALAGYLGRARGVRGSAEDVVVCTGAGHGMGLVFATLARLGRSRVAIEDPSSRRLRDIAAAAGMSVTALPCDTGGARVEVLRRLQVDAVVVTPAHQFPLGVTLTAERRAAVVAWARECGGLVVEDDYDGELRYDRQPVGALQALDPDSVIYVGTTSKSLAPALRVGWLVATTPLRAAVVETLGLVNAVPSSLEQLGLARLIETGGFDRHIRRMRMLYRQRRDLLVETLARAAPALQVTGIAAGGHALVRLGVDGPGEAEAIGRAAERGLALTGLGHYWHAPQESGEWPGPALVVGYATPAGRSHRAAIAVLGECLTSRC